MTNNQRFLAELLVLLSLGSLFVARANPRSQEEAKRQSTQDTVTAHQFVLVDQNNKPRCTLRVHDSGAYTELSLQGADGVERVRLDDKDNGTLKMSNPQGSATALSEGKLEMTQKDGKQGATLARGYVNVTFQKPANIKYGANDEYKLWYIAEFLDSRTESGIDLVEDKDDRPRVELFQKGHKPRFIIP